MASPYYIHAIDPVLVHLWGPIAVRWYGLAYVAGFLVSYGFLMRWSRQGALRLDGEGVQSLIFYCVLGVLLGGRLGFLLFYDFPQWRDDPSLLFKVWQGGMSSHGGLVGLAVVLFLFGRAQRVPFLHLTDALVCVGPLGIFFGRMANFVNGELWGRVTTVKWAVLFPQEAGWFPPQPFFREEALRLYEAGHILPRHPSQLYAALVEGWLVWALLMALRRTAWARSDGRLSAVFLAMYATGRIAVEGFREPEIVHFGWLTQGQLLSALLFVPAVWIFVRSRKSEVGS